MTEGNDTTATLDSNDVQTELERAEIILERVEEYREAAERIDGKYSRANEHRSPSLNEMPYGEELIRTKDLPGSLSEAAKKLRAILEAKFDGRAAKAAFESVVKTIDDAEATLEDCTPIRESEAEDE
ncbi:hypothetical protein VDF76_20345 [Xanthomonas campestris pv. raphani]|uniref:hypothetical protein n=1 Tax=Xanthomonas campestris TaxID=339 RepID=UPI002B221CA9|nr:hypothetical protein [Xanthomonas campestris]MEA9749293.1 hypothetical protein [Xanthomonas campestris pv. raphani]MEA9850056.1 hypothetical protein [Xanthomonas campestris pv. raphani]MEA9931287.1 hypothetical protein [Xanthomonas campestris pv. raphani]